MKICILILIKIGGSKYERRIKKKLKNLEIQVEELEEKKKENYKKNIMINLLEF